jgi:hypothetical protein
MSYWLLSSASPDNDQSIVGMYRSPFSLVVQIEGGGRGGFFVPEAPSSEGVADAESGGE